ncbi:P-loop containing nucleoside triphosphate hydrolase protein [Sistotremastrum suecicum HHB10207 ss-3]|uniref:DNA 3'-5' helicase n=1 Tax=Sistotremastrum suecicum HHB10207 ss-3 TaxID=1314776 RepID=A0A165XDX5_9AGAM|nr:P-loop containing nucleoside triphosphate hydrolase protein [Sistotremastrum suecicum HHB10207 ss-3]
MPPTNNHVEIWPRKSKWHQAIRNADRKRLHALGAFPTSYKPEDSWLLAIRKPVLRYFKRAIAGTASLTPDTRAQLKNPYPREFNHAPAAYSEPQESVTFTTYARYGVQLLATLLRSVHTPVPGFPITFTEAQNVHIQALYQALQQKLPGHQILPLIHPLLFSLIQRFSGRVADDDFRCPLLCANIATNINADGQLRDIRAIAPTFTRFQWCIRGIVATHIVQRPPGVSEDTACLPIADLILEHEPTPFSRNRRNIHTIKYIIDGTPSKPSVSFSEDGEDVECWGDVLPITDLTSGTVKAVDDVENEFYNIILRGLQYPELKALLSRYYDPRDHGVRTHDNHRCTTPGYTFIWDTRNPFEEFRFRFLADLVDNKVDCEGNNFWVDGKLNPAAITHWNRQIALWWEKTIMLAHVTAGGPSRAPELATTTTCQLHDGDRKVHCCQDHLCLLCTYSKSSENTSVDKMVLKPLPKRLSIIIHMFLVLVRPAEQALAPYAGMTAQQQENLATHLFVAEGEIISAARIRFLMRKFSASYFHVALSYNQMRHILKAIILRESGYDLDHIEPHEDRAVDAVFLHKRSTANRFYAVHPEDLESARQPAFQAYLQIGYLMHEFFGLREPRSTSDSPSSTSDHHTNQNLPAILGQLLDGLDARINDRFTSLRDSVFLALRQAVHNLNSPPPSDPIEASLRRPLDLDIDASRLTLLRRYLIDVNRYSPTMLEDFNPGFRSLEQAQLVDHILHVKGHLAVVLPTGGGKSMGPAAAAYAFENVPGIILVFTPFVALMDNVFHDLSRVAPTARFGCDDWSPFTTKILLISLEHLTDPKHLRTLMTMRGHIKYIFLDEIHEALINNKFRSLFDELQQIVSLGCPIIMMSATLPPTSVPQLLNRLNIAEAKIIRKHITSRPEIRYSTHQTTKEQLPSDVSEFIDSHPCDTDDRALVICSTKKQLEALAKKHGGLIYHSDLTREERELAAAQWHAGLEPSHRIMFATKGFGVGVNHKSVRWVLFAGSPQHMIDFDQPAGRAGRDGRPCEVVLIWDSLPHRFSTSDPEELEHGGFEPMRRLLTNTTRCLRYERGLHIDGVAITCATLVGDHLQLCDRCRARSREHANFVAVADLMRLPETSVPEPVNHHVESVDYSQSHLRPIPPTQPQSTQTSSSSATTKIPTDDVFSSLRNSSMTSFTHSSQATTLVGPSTPTHSRLQQSISIARSSSGYIPGAPGSPTFSQAVKRTVHQAHHTPRKVDKRLKPSSPSPRPKSSLPPPPGSPTPIRGSIAHSTISRLQPDPRPIPFHPESLPSSSKLSTTPHYPSNFPPAVAKSTQPSSTSLPAAVPHPLQLPTFPQPTHSLPTTATPLSLRDKTAIERKAEFDAAVLRIVAKTSDASEAFRKLDWSDGCPLEFVLTKYGILQNHPDTNADGMPEHHHLYRCSNSLMKPAFEDQWKQWRHRLTDRCQIRSSYHTRCWGPTWAPNHWYHHKNTKGDCPDFLKDFWVALWYSPDRNALIAHVSFDQTIAVTNVFEYQAWLVKRWNPGTLLINGIVLVHEWLRMHDAFNAV